MNFSTLKGLTIPEGNVKQISDAQGNVLWSADDGMRTITLSSLYIQKEGYAYLVVDGVSYYPSTVAGEQLKLTFPIGTQIRFVSKAIAGVAPSATTTIKLNGQSVVSQTANTGEGEAIATYDYVLNGNLFVTMTVVYMMFNGQQQGAGTIAIAETYAVNLNTVANGTLTAPGTGNAGSTVTLTPTPDEGYGYGGAIVTYTLNGVEQTINLDANTTTFTMPAADVTVTPVWKALINFTMNGETYQAIEGMSWSAWFASSYNTTGETKGTITDASGNEVSMDAVIVSGVAYEVGFAPPMVTVTLISTDRYYKTYPYYAYAQAIIDGNAYIPATTAEVGSYNYLGILDDGKLALSLPVGTEIELRAGGSTSGTSRNSIYLNGVSVGSNDDAYKVYTYTVTGETTIDLRSYCDKEVGPSMYASYGRIYITET